MDPNSKKNYESINLWTIFDEEYRNFASKEKKWLREMAKSAFKIRDVATAEKKNQREKVPLDVGNGRAAINRERARYF